MKQSPHMQRVAARMAPGVLCRDGFVGDEPRRLELILETDASTIAGLGVTHEAIAARLGDIFDRARAGLGTPVPVGEGLVATYHEGMGRIPCPWGGCGTFPKGEVELRHAESGERLLFTALSVHMIAAHGFYQGRGSRYRIEPRAAARLLGLTEEA